MTPNAAAVEGVERFDCYTHANDGREIEAWRRESPTGRYVEASGFDRLAAENVRLREALKLYVDADFYKGGDTSAAYDHNERLSKGKFALYGDQQP